MGSGSFFKRPGVLLVLGLGVVGGLVSLADKLVSNRGSVEKRTVLADPSQSRNCPAFSPDGRKLAFCARPATGGQGDFRVSVSEVAPGTASGASLTRGEGSETSPAFSPDGKKLAFLRLNGHGAQAVVAPVNAIGDAAAERVLPLGWDDKDVDAERSKDRPTRAMVWSRDGKSLVVISPPALALLSLDTGKLRRITNPGEDQADRSPAVSPDGYYLAFVRGAFMREAGGESADIYTCDLGGGGLARLTYDNDEIRGLDWSADGREVVYAAARGTGWHLWRILAAGGSPREILAAGNGAADPAIARAGNKLAFAEAPVTQSIWRKRIAGEKDDSAGEPFIRTEAAETYPSFSPDGRQVADVSNQSGHEEVWLTDVESGGRAQVTDFHGPALGGVRWSPDGKTLLIAERDGGASIFLVPASARRGNPAPAHITGGANPTFSRDGKSIFYEAGRMIYRAAPDGSRARSLTGPPASAPEPSADGKFVYFRRGRAIWRVPSAGGNAEEAIDPEHILFGSSFAAVPGGIYYLEFNRSFRAVDLAFYRYSTSKSSEVLRMTGAQGSFGSGFTISPDGKTVLYPKIDRSQTNLVVIENWWHRL
jgi:Tol biopolymer transport system component